MRLFETENLSDQTAATSERTASPLDESAAEAPELDCDTSESMDEIGHTTAEETGFAWAGAPAKAANEVGMPDFRGDDLVSFVCAVAGSECALTPMELEVARMRLLGWQRQAIANHMGRSTHTIDSHLKAVRRKLGSGSATALFKAAVDTLNRRARVAARELD